MSRQSNLYLTLDSKVTVYEYQVFKRALSLYTKKGMNAADLLMITRKLLRKCLNIDDQDTSTAVNILKTKQKPDLILISFTNFSDNLMINDRLELRINLRK